MTITVTWDDHESAPTSFTVPEDVLASLERFRLALREIRGNDWAVVYPTVKDMIVGVFVKSLVMPAIQQFPPASIAAAQANLAAAQAALVVAQVAAIPGFTPVGG